MDYAIGSHETWISSVKTYRRHKRPRLGGLSATCGIGKILASRLPHSSNAAPERKVIDLDVNNLVVFKERTTGLQALRDTVAICVNKLALGAGLDGALFWIAIVVR